MNKSLGLNSILIIIGIPLVLLGTTAWIITSTQFASDPLLNLAITVDLLLTIPLVYALLIRKTNIPKTTIVPVMLIGLVVGSIWLPEQHQDYLGLFKTWALPLLELFILAFVVIKVRKAIMHYRAMAHEQHDLFTVLKAVCRSIVPSKLVYPLATEIAVIYYGFFDWKTPELTERMFTHHRKSGTPALFAAFLVVILVETVALHLLLARWNAIAAWVLTALSMYTGLQVFGWLRSLSKRPIVIGSETLHLKYGLLNETIIPIADIASVELSSKRVQKEEGVKHLSPLGELERHNVVLLVNTSQTLIGIYGFQSNFKTLLFHVDDPATFKSTLENQINQRAAK